MSLTQSQPAPGEVKLMNPNSMAVLRVLNVTGGDTKLSFDPANEQDRERTARVVGEMLRAGYAIFITVGEKDGKPLYQRVENFDPNTCEYLIVGDPPTIETPATEGTKRRGNRGHKVTRVRADRTLAMAVAPSAGG